MIQMAWKRVCAWLLGLTVCPVAVLLLRSGAKELLLPVVNLFHSDTTTAAAIAEFFFLDLPCYFVLLLLPAGALCWHFLSWRTAAIRFLLYLVWVALLTMFSVYAYYRGALTIPMLIQVSGTPVFMEWLAGGLLWLLLNSLHCRAEKR